MTEFQALPTAAAWSMRQATATGAKEWRVLLFDRYVIVGWGAVAGTMQYKVYDEGNAWSANYKAQSSTAKKEREGYHLYHEPVLSEFQSTYWTGVLDQWKGHRGKSMFLDASFRGMFNIVTR